MLTQVHLDMSYDLYLSPRSGTLDFEALRSWFASRQNYALQDDTVFYGNEDTGVHFRYHLHPDLRPEDEPFSLALEINYFRPSYFALEAEPEVTALVEEFDLLVMDPQIDGMGEGEYRREGFLSGWNTGNAFAYRAILSSHPDKPYMTMDTTRLENIWKWNMKRARRAQVEGKQSWIPRISFAEYGGHLTTFAVWPDGSPSILPPTDLVVIGRSRYAPRRFFILPSRDICLAGWDEVLPLLERHGKRQDDSSWIFDKAPPPADIIAFLRSLKPEMSGFKAVTSDNVLNRELLDQARTEGMPGITLFDPPAGKEE